MVFSLIGESEEAPVVVTSDEVDDHINEAASKLAHDSGILEMRYDINLEVGVAEYELRQYSYDVFRAAVDDEAIPATTLRELEQMDELWESRTGEVDRWMTDRFNGSNLRVWRTPTEAGAGVFSSEYGVVVAHGTDTFEAGLLSSAPRWTIVPTYYVGDHVLGGFGAVPAASYGVEYVCILEHSPRISVNAPGYGTDWMAYWAVVTASVWLVGKVYNLGDRVTYSGTEYVCIRAHTSGINDLPGVGPYWQVYWVTASTGDLGAVVDFEPASLEADRSFASELGVGVYSGISGVLEVWSKREHPDLTMDAEVSELPSYTHTAIAFLAAATILDGRDSELVNTPLAEFYRQLALVHESDLKKAVIARSKETTHRMGRSRHVRNQRRFVRLPGNYPGY